MTSFGPTKRIGPSADLTIRLARTSDALALFRLAALDSSRVPRGRVLLAVVGGEPWAAVSIDDSHAVADPFRPSGELLMLLLERARQIRREEKARQRRDERRTGGARRAWRPALS
jgi:hypothetical protein